MSTKRLIQICVTCHAIFYFSLSKEQTEHNDIIIHSSLSSRWQLVLYQCTAASFPYCVGASEPQHHHHHTSPQMETFVVVGMRSRRYFGWLQNIDPDMVFVSWKQGQKQLGGPPKICSGGMECDMAGAFDTWSE